MRPTGSTFIPFPNVGKLVEVVRHNLSFPAERMSRNATFVSFTLAMCTKRMEEARGEAPHELVDLMRETRGKFEKLKRLSALPMPWRGSMWSEDRIDRALRCHDEVKKCDPFTDRDKILRLAWDQVNCLTAVEKSLERYYRRRLVATCSIAGGLLAYGLTKMLGF